jgi:hypothetical protein
MYLTCLLVLNANNNPVFGRAKQGTKVNAGAGAGAGAGLRFNRQQNW